MNGTEIQFNNRQLRLFGDYWDFAQVEPVRMNKVLVEGQITENNITEIEQPILLEKIADPRNLLIAFKHVKANKGACGIDQMNIEEAEAWLLYHVDDLSRKIVAGKYKPQAVRRVEIPKDNGTMRKLGIPTVIDRVVQQSIAQVLEPIYEPQFVETSYGFRPNRSAHDALLKCQEYLNEGSVWAVDMDLEKFFDTVNHSKLIQVLSETIIDGRVIGLIHKYLNAGVMIGEIWEQTDEGVPQGGPLSPLLANILLNDLDHFLEDRGHKFVRYADDMVIFKNSRSAANRVMKSTIDFVENKLYLKVNQEKTEVVYANKIKFLGYGFYKSKDGFNFRVHPKSKKKMKAKVREITHRSNFKGYAILKKELMLFIRGWVNYYRLAKMRGFLHEIDAWMRRRIRKLYWIHWKRVRTRYRELRKLGLSHQKAYEYACTRKKSWRVAFSQILTTTLTNKELENRGYIMFSSYYQQVAM